MSHRPRVATRPRLETQSGKLDCTPPNEWASVVIVVQHAHGRCFQIIHLSAPGGPDEGEHSDAHNNQRQRQHNKQNAHDTLRSDARENDFPYHDPNTTVRELVGISTAAISGLRMPTTAIAAPMIL